MKGRKTKAIGAEGWWTESLEPHFHNFERFGPRGVEEIDSWLPERPFWALPSWIHNSCAFAFRYPLLSTNNLAGAVTSPSVAQTDLTLPTACEGDTVLVPLSRMWQPRLGDSAGSHRKWAGIQVCQPGEPTVFCMMRFLVPSVLHLPEATFSLLLLCFHLPIKLTVTLHTKSHVYKSIAISCISLLMLKDS